MTTPAEVVARRRAERAALIDLARAFADGLDPGLGVRAVVVFGSVARGDFNAWSDIDVLVVAEHVARHPLQRASRFRNALAQVEVVAWTPKEWAAQRARGNPIAVEALRDGVWLVGSSAALVG